MRVILLFLACFLISVLCEIEKNEDGNLIQVKSNDILVRNLRGAEGNQKNNNGKSKSNKKKVKRKRNNKKKAKKSDIKKKTSKPKGRRNKTKKQKSKRNGKVTKGVKKSKKNGHRKKSKKQKRKNGRTKHKGKKISTKSNTKNKARKQKRKKKTGKPKPRKGLKSLISRPRQTSTCNGTSLGSTCLSNLISSLKYERDFVANFMNQKARAESFNKLIGNKGGKTDSFQNSTTYLLIALGGNMSSLTCGSSNSSGELAVSTYNTLSNCGPSVEMACTVPNNTVNFTQLDTCKTYYKTIQTKNAECFTMTMKKDVDETAVCECWKTAAAAVENAKLKKDSCSATTAQSDLKDLKNACTAAFGVCKKAEDAAVGYIFECNGGGSSSSSDNTTASSSSSSSTNSSAGARAARLRLF